jgi:replication gene A protein
MMRPSDTTAGFMGERDYSVPYEPLRPALVARIEELGRSRYERARWLPYQLLQFPDEFRDGLLDAFEQLLRAGQHVAASLYFFERRRRLKPQSLSLASSDEEIVELAKKHAEHCVDVGGYGLGLAYSFFHARMYARDAGVRPPKISATTTESVAFRMLCDSQWWRRQLRVTHARAVEQEAIGLGLVHRFRSLYVSDSTFGRWQQQTARNRRVLADLTAVNELGEAFSVEELASRSVANPHCRRAELMARLAGFEAYAIAKGHVAVMYTVTCPSRMHARVFATGALNSKYDGTSPAAAQDYLCGLWECIRSALHRAGIRIYGMRVAEPQHDGTPHWHILLFLLPETLAAVGDILCRYALAADSEEPGAKEHRVSIVNIDYSKGTATGYLAKYVSKNIDGEHLEKSDAGASHRAMRTRAWASVWGIRQFQQIGNPIVTIWRELRRGVDAEGSEIVHAAAQAANDGDWHGYTDAMGGPQVARKGMPIQLLKSTEARLGRYGQPTSPLVIGVTSQDGDYETRHHVWRIGRGSVGQGPLEFCQ